MAELVSVTQIIPSSELKGLETALSELAQVASILPELKAKAEAFTVIKTADECGAAKTVLGDIRSLRKVSGFKIDPFSAIVKQVQDFLRGEKKSHEEKCDALDAPLEAKIKTYMARERAEAQKEQDRKNEEIRQKAKEKADADAKAAKEKVETERKERVKEINRALKVGEIGKREAAKLLKEAGAYAEAAAQQADLDAEAAKNAPVPQVKVEPNIPTKSGVVIRTNFRAEVVDADSLIMKHSHAAFTGDAKTAAYLRQFITVDVQALGAEARKVKDSKKLESLIPGIHAFEE